MPKNKNKKLSRRLKDAMPMRLRLATRRLKTKYLGAEKAYRGKTNSEIFDKIYLDGAWGRDQKGSSTSGFGSHDGSVIDPYVSQIIKFLQEKDIKTAVDLGCGDFNIGSKLAEYCEKYYACDVSDVILRENEKNYSLPNVEFLNLDLSKDKTPAGDAAFIRQVLQHLSNDDIGTFVDYISNNDVYKYLVVTEHVPTDPKFPRNIDKPAGAGIRVSMNSGVVLHEAPFNLKYKRKEILLEISNPFAGVDAVIQTIIYEF